MADYIHGGTDLREVARLIKQALVWVAPRMLQHFTATPGMRVLDLGTGVGAMAAALVRRHPGIEVWGLDLRAAQLRQAKALHPVATYVQGDATRLPFADASFDRVHASWVLEHIPDPASVLREVCRVPCPWRPVLLPRGGQHHLAAASPLQRRRGGPAVAEYRAAGRRR